MVKVRIDKLLTELKLASSHEHAQALIMSGNVLVNDVPVTKCGQQVSADSDIRIRRADHPYVGRGGLKLAKALKEFKIDVTDKICVDVGSSTGGFTDCLLQNGAKKVYAIDVGYGQLAWKLRSDPRVIVMEKTNIKDVGRSAGRQVGRSTNNSRLADLQTCRPVDMVVIDVSFISLEKVLPHVDNLVDTGGIVVSLIKPQFEVDKGLVGDGGIVRDPTLYTVVIDKIGSAAKSLGWQIRGVVESPIKGADGNVEFLACFVK